MADAAPKPLDVAAERRKAARDVALSAAVLVMREYDKSCGDASRREAEERHARALDFYISRSSQGWVR